MNIMYIYHIVPKLSLLVGLMLLKLRSRGDPGSFTDIMEEFNIQISFHGNLSVLYTCTCICFQYQVPREGVSWATLFRTLEENKKDLQIEDYLVSQTTLEQVFIYFARAQIDPVDFQAGCCNRFQQSCCFCCTAEYIKASSANLQT